MDSREISFFRNNERSFIELQGFLSTSLNEDVAYKFLSNTIIQIKVRKNNLKGTLDNGFAYLNEKVSVYFEEEEIIFNPINVF